MKNYLIDAAQLTLMALVLWCLTSYLEAKPPQAPRPAQAPAIQADDPFASLPAKRLACGCDEGDPCQCKRCTANPKTCECVACQCVKAAKRLPQGQSSNRGKRCGCEAGFFCSCKTSCKCKHCQHRNCPGRRVKTKALPAAQAWPVRHQTRSC